MDLFGLEIDSVGLILSGKILAGLSLHLIKSMHTIGFSILCQTIVSVSFKNLLFKLGAVYMEEGRS